MENNLAHIETFFATSPLGLEELVKEEILQLLPMAQEVTKNHGGIEFKCGLIDTVSVLPYLKCPTKLLVRLDEFKARDVPKLFNKLQKVNWKKFLISTTPKISSNSSDSRLFDERKVIKATEDALKAYFEHNPLKKKTLQLNELAPKTEVLLRFANDICTVSIDLSGERLDRRNYKLNTGKAPIRENIAAALIKSLLKVSPSDTIIDPMCGSGTLLFEATTLSFPQKHREFYANFLPQVRGQIKKVTIKENQISAIGHDLNAEIINQAQANLSRLKEFHNVNITFKQQDFFTSEKLTIPCNVIVNPPYDERIKINESNDNFFNTLIEKIKECYGPKAIGIIIPDNISCKFKKNAKVKIPFVHGGLRVTFFVI